MKLYFTCGKTKILVGEPQNPEEMAILMIEDSKRRFISPKGKIDLNFKPGAEFAVSNSGKYLLEE